jgi:flagellar hook-basal body complex protein FliE
MMNPLDALSALTHVQVPAATGGINFQPTGPTTPGAPISEAFQNLLQPAQSTQPATAVAPDAGLAPLGGGGSPATWGHMFQQMVLDVNSQQQTASAKVADVLKGGPTPVHDAMVSTEEASLSFEMLAEMRNKIVDAYQQVMQMQV